MQTIITASDLKHAYQTVDGGHFFDRKSMKFFGDTMSNYYVPVKNGTARVFNVETHTGTHQCYALERKRPVNGGLYKTAYFDVNTFEYILPKKD